MRELRLGEPDGPQFTHAACSDTTAANRAQRERRYRAKGWWPGERLCDRYTVLAQRFENRLAVADATGRRLSHGTLWRESGRLAENLKEGGIGRGDIVILLLPNIVVGQVAFVALLRLGAIPASLPTRTDPDTVAYVAGLTGARALISVERHGSARLGDIAREAASTCGHGLGVCLVDESVGTWRSAPTNRGTPSPANAANLAHIMFTSSTTGRPKAVMHSEDTLAALNIGFTERFSLGSDAPIFLASPLGHSIGAIHGTRLSLHTGAPLVLQGRLGSRTCARNDRGVRLCVHRRGDAVSEGSGGHALAAFDAEAGAAPFVSMRRCAGAAVTDGGRAGAVSEHVRDGPLGYDRGWARHLRP